MSRYEVIADFITSINGEVVEASAIDASKPRVLAFHGALAATRKEAETALKLAQDFFQDVGLQGYDFYATYYTRKTLMGFLRYERGSEKDRDAIKEEFKQALVPVFNDILLPLVQKDGQRLPAEEVAANFSKIVLRGHCMGSLLITDLGNLLVEKMRELGYSEQEIRELTFKIKAIFTSSIVLPHEIEANFDIYSFINLGDNELFKYAGEDWRANLMYMLGAKKPPEAPIYHTLQADNIKIVLLSSHLDNATKAELESEVKKAIEAGDKGRVRKLEKVLLGHAWSLITRPYKEFDGVRKAYEVFKEMVSKGFKGLS